MLNTVYSNRQTPYLIGKFEEFRAVCFNQNYTDGPPQKIEWVEPPSYNTIEGLALVPNGLFFNKAGLYFISANIETIPQSGADVSFTSELMITKFEENQIVPSTIVDNVNCFVHTGTNGHIQRQNITTVLYMQPNELIQFLCRSVQNAVPISVTSNSFLQVTRIG